MFVNNEDVSDKIRTTQVSMMASKISAVPVVREFLLELQRSLAMENNVIMDGRDIGTVVLPNAQVKIFLTASAECRAKEDTMTTFRRETQRNLMKKFFLILKSVTTMTHIEQSHH